MATTQEECPPGYWSPILKKCMWDNWESGIDPGYCDPGTTT